MNKFKLALISYFLMGLALPALGEESVRFEFMQKLGEGGIEIYRLDMDVQAGSGEFCFANSSGSEIDMEVRDKIYAGVPWSRLVNIEKITHACATIYVYEPNGRFYTPRMKYGAVGHEHVFFFIGQFKAGKMEGVVYEFVDLPTGEGTKVIRSPDEFDVNVRGKKITVSSKLKPRSP